MHTLNTHTYCRYATDTHVAHMQHPQILPHTQHTHIRNTHTYCRYTTHTHTAHVQNAHILHTCNTRILQICNTRKYCRCAHKEATGGLSGSIRSGGTNSTSFTRTINLSCLVSTSTCVGVLVYVAGGWVCCVCVCDFSVYVRVAGVFVRCTYLCMYVAVTCMCCWVCDANNCVREHSSNSKRMNHVHYHIISITRMTH